MKNKTNNLLHALLTCNILYYRCIHFTIRNISYILNPKEVSIVSSLVYLTLLFAESDLLQISPSPTYQHVNYLL